MSKSFQPKSNEIGKGRLQNTRDCQVTVTRANGAQFNLAPRGIIRNVSRTDFQPLPPGVVFIPNQ